MDWNQLTIAEVTGVVRVYDAAGKRIVISDRYASALIFPLTGRIRFSQNDRVVIADRLHPVIIPQGADYVNECVESAESLMINFMMSGPTDGLIETTPPVDPACAESAFERMQIISAQKRRETRFALLAEAYRLMERMFRQPPEAGEHLLEPAIALIMERYGEPGLCNQDMARAARVSEPYLRALFKKQLGTTPMRYLTGIRMEKARSLLMEGHAVRQTAVSVGYGDIYQFSRAFRNQTGCPPGQYARQQRKSVDDAKK